MICLALILRARQRARTARQQTQQTLPSVGAGVFQRRRGSEAARFRASPSPRFRGLFGLPGHFPPSSPRRSRLVARFVAVILFSPRSVSSLGFSRSACVFRLGVEASGGSEAVLRSFPRFREPPPTPPFWQGRPGHDFASGGRLGRDCSSASVVCRLHVDFCH